MEKLKIVIVGPVGAGKTSFIRSISEVEVVDTDRRATDETATRKHNTTVAMDYGKLTLKSGKVLYLHGAPGQARFDFMWEILIRGVHGYILLVDAHRPQDFHSARQILNFVKERIQAPMIIGITHTDCEDAWEVDDVCLALGLLEEEDRPPIVVVNAISSSSVAKCLVTLLEHLLKVAAAVS
ncbi:MAG: ATP/GTP-binding protein [Prochloraceae cyanobacterium]|nr:ATP/GTP-binding protein [Prochloraceae cyanobacterium]